MTNVQTKIKVAVTYRVCQRWRLPIFKRLANIPDIQLMIFHGQDLSGTKLINAKNFGTLQHQELKTWSMHIKSSGRKVPAILYPGIIKALETYNPDVLLCEGGSNIFNNLLIYWWAEKNQIPTIWWDLGKIPGRKYHGISRLYRNLRLSLMRRSSVLLGYSTRATDYFREERLCQPIFKAVNCVDTDRVFERIKETQSIQPTLRERIGLENCSVILYVGAIEPAKRLDVLLKAYQKVKEQNKKAILLLVGDGPKFKETKQLAADLSLSDVHFAGRIHKNVSEYFLAADLFVLPGLGGLAISEAMAHGLPVICTTADGCECDLIKAGQNGMILPEGDSDAFAQNILKLIDNPKTCSAMGKNSLSIIHHEHNIHTYIQGIIDSIHCANQLRQIR